ncbi:SET and MYND domain-containing protein 4 [Cylas formicarius]|uniref:SET and MYND domain-containing protein 4 n=1 Tax=Cylas formicarius TaxID=197179 RepID=UPI0029587AAC|nr:SET and MYND domain-containing protein 4 [Cylas formicarius]
MARPKENVYREICSEKTLQSNGKGFFLTFVECVEQNAGKEWIETRFGRLKTDKERLKTVFVEAATGETLKRFLSNVREVYRPKNAEFSRKKRAEAETSLERGEHQKSFVLFSQSVLRAPRQDLPLALWGRSQALLKMNKFSLALSDVQLALKEGLADEYKALAFWSMGVCHKAMDDANKARVSFGLAEKLLVNDAGLLKSLKCDETRTVAEEKPKKRKIKTPEILNESVGSLAGASAKLSLKKSDELGRYVVANKNISTGETLVVEEPYAACLLPEMFGTHCHHCFARLESAVGCTECSSVAFCCTACRDRAISTYHRYECKYLDLLIGSGMSILSHTALRMITQYGLERCLKIYENRDEENVYRLCCNADKRTSGDFLQRTLMAAFLLKCLQESGFFGNTRQDTHVFPTEPEFHVGELLLYNLQMLQFNAHEVYETLYPTKHHIRDSKTLYIGVGIYATASLFNHDCHPALTRHFSGKKIVLTAARPLDANDNVPENYGPIFTRKSLTERQKYLAGRYWFKCGCFACKQDWPTLKNGLGSVSERIRCPREKCLGFFTCPLKNETPRCPKCKQTVNLSDRVLLLRGCKEEYNGAFEIMNSGDTRKAADILQAAINTFYRVSLPPHKDTQLAEEMLRACVADTGNTTECYAK